VLVSVVGINIAAPDVLVNTLLSLVCSNSLDLRLVLSRSIFMLFVFM
jgi:hypothetical protein